MYEFCHKDLRFFAGYTGCIFNLRFGFKRKEMIYNVFNPSGDRFFVKKWIKNVDFTAI